jgi:hypothetical protein
MNQISNDLGILSDSIGSKTALTSEASDGERVMLQRPIAAQIAFRTARDRVMIWGGGGGGASDLNPWRGRQHRPAD